jgi:nicotinamidase-related amidase
MTMTTIDRTAALVVTDLQKGIVSPRTDNPVTAVVKQAFDHGHHVVLATDAMSDLDPGAHRHRIDRAFPKLGETAANAEVIDRAGATR